MSVGVIAGIAAGGGVAGIVLIGCIVYFVRKRSGGDRKASRVGSSAAMSSTTPV